MKAWEQGDLVVSVPEPVGGVVILMHARLPSPGQLCPCRQDPLGKPQVLWDYGWYTIATARVNENSAGVHPEDGPQRMMVEGALHWEETWFQAQL